MSPLGRPSRGARGAGFGSKAVRGRDAGGRGAADDLDAGDAAETDPAAAEADAYAGALRLLARREHSQRELQRKLDRKGHAGEAAAGALARLQQQTFQSDDRFAALLVRSRVSQGQGPLRILAELRSHGIDDAAARAALDAEGADWAERAADLYRRRYSRAGAADPAERRKRAGFLLRRGFDAATVRAITHADDVDDSAEEFD